MSTRKPIIFISYAHADEPEKLGPEEVQWLSFVTGYLRPALKHGAVEIWIDRLMKGGADWEREIAAKLRACDIFVLLVSRHSLSSDYIVDKEIAVIRERQAKREDVHFYPLLLTPTPKIAMQLAQDKNLRPRGGKPFSAFSLHERFDRMSDAADEIAEIAAAVMRNSAIALPGGVAITAKSNPTIPKATPISHVAKESNKGNAAAQLNIGQLYYTGQGVEQDYAKAMVWYRKAADQGHPVAQNAIGWLYQNGFGVEQDYAEALAWYQKAADQGYATAQHNIAELYYNGHGVAQNYAQTLAWNSKAAEKGHSAAQNDIGWLYQNGYGVNQDFVEAMAWYQKAADQGNSTAQHNIGRLYYNGQGVRQDYAQAFAWYLKAAERGLAIAQNDLGWLYQNGFGVQQDYAQALAWYQKAADQGAAARKENDRSLDNDGEILDRQFTPTPATPGQDSEREDEGSAPDTRPLPPPLPDQPNPFTYRWNVSQRIAIVAGLQNLPYFGHFKSEEDHRHVLEACRVGATRLREALLEGRYNARPEYAETLGNYLEDLPKIAGAGNILLAYDQALDLRKMFLADADWLPAAFASRLERVISNQFALNGFYDLVQRHNEAVASAKWTQAFPTDAAREFFGVVEANTPKFFEPEVGEKVQRIEATAEVGPAAQATGAPSSAPQPPPLPAGSPDPKRSAEHQVAASANALYEVFLKGKDLPLAIEGWSRVAHAMGDAIGPILTFLKGL